LEPKARRPRSGISKQIWWVYQLGEKGRLFYTGLDALIIIITIIRIIILYILYINPNNIQYYYCWP
jgi:hypothetical protein